MGRGYIRIVEAILLLIILFSLIIFIMQSGPTTQPNPSNPTTLIRYGKDLTNMVCNSDRARRFILIGNLIPVYRDLVYVTPPEYQVRLVTDDGSIGTTPNSSNVISQGCVVSDMFGNQKNVTVQVWV